MAQLIFITHPEVIVDPDRPVDRWRLSPVGIERMRQFAEAAIVGEGASIWSSTETKAIEAAGILAGRLGVGFRVRADLGENDRRATGFLPATEFEEMADAFFARPDASIRGWETAIDAQRRVHDAVLAIVSESGGGDIAVVAHGAVGTLLFCALAGHPIARAYDQPFQGHYWRASLPELKPLHSWRSIA